MTRPHLFPERDSERTGSSREPTELSTVSRRDVLGATAGTALALTTGAKPVRATADDQDSKPADASVSRLDGLEAFVDETMSDALETHSVAGAAVSIVADGEILLSKGYGHTVLDPDVQITDESLFHVASVSKPITYAAAMQLVDRGEVDPHEDVNEYLESVSVPETEDEPIELAHLATHTAGFEVRARGDAADSVDRLRPLDEAVADPQPSRIVPPGEVPAYTNYAAALTGQLVADVTGMPFEEYVDRSVFEPLGMEDSTFDPAPDGLGGGPGQVYLEEAGWFSDVPPASGLSTTARDMARFSRALLAPEEFDSSILSPSAVERMHQQWYTPHERLNGFAFGLFEGRRNGVRTIGHSGGDIPGFGASRLYLVPDHGIGLFVTAQDESTSAPMAAVEEFVDAFFDEYLPDESDEVDDSDGRPAMADELEGTYRDIHGAKHTTYERLLFAQQTIEVQIDSDGTLVTDNGMRTDEWVEVEPLVFRHVDGDRTLAFREEDRGIVYMFVDGNPTAFVPITRVEALDLHAGAAAVSLLVMLTALVGWPLGAVWRRYQNRSSPGSKQRRARWIAAGAAGWPFAFVLGITLVLGILGLGRLMNPPTGFDLLFLLPIAGAVATLWAGSLAVRAWREGWWSRSMRVHYTAVVGASTVLLLLFWYWNLVALPP